MDGADLLEFIQPINLLVVLNVLGELLFSKQEVLLLPVLLAVLISTEISAPLMLQETVIFINVSITDVIVLKDICH